MILVEHVVKNYNQSNLAYSQNPLSFQVESGDSLAIFGSSGSGKTTLLHMICGLIQPDKGRISHSGKCVVCFSEDRLIDHKSALENVLLPLCSRTIGMNHNKALPHVRGLLIKLGFTEEQIVSQPVSCFSKGMARRVNVARAVAVAQALLEKGEEVIMLLDEPYSGLDEVTAEKVTAMILSCKDPKLTLVLVSHNEEEARWLQIDRKELLCQMLDNNPEI